jgi:GTP-binding protein
MFVDQIKVHAKAGEGGNGCVSFLREKFIPKGGPNGGDGGRGGDIILRADTHTDNLATFFYEPIIRGLNGGNGLGKNLYGRGAKPKHVRVPVGTLVYRMHGAPPPPPDSVKRGVTFYDLEKSEPETPEPEVPVKRGIDIHSPELELIADLTQPGQEFVLCKGGAGGKGNVHFKSSTNRIPRECTPGEAGEEGDFVFELRTIADAGLVGYPNAGKSTLLGRISSAHPKVAPYPFTTLHPIIGVVEFDGFARATVADIPGLIEGAHLNVGLGHEFLRHIVRCKVLLYVLDMAGSEGRNPIEDLGTLRKELKLYDPTLPDRPWIVIANKMDLEGAAENLKAFKRRFRKREVIPISASENEGIDALKLRLQALVGEIPASAASASPV